jgi:phenylpropionate dioxygenase-like ring-hydroxylating dioxygenase large terminal subunit
MNDSAFDTHLGSIPADHYIRDDIFPREMKNIFEPSWLCIGFTEDLKNHNDFITTQIGERGIVVQNFHGELRAFRNVCSHRYSRIQTQRCGNRPLQCPYHGWTFDSQGLPSGIPMNRQCFGFDDADKKRLALQNYCVDTVGHFVFVRMSTEGPSLLEFLGNFYDDLQHVSEICTDRFETASFEWAANWKVGMDNAAEGYHVPLVHPNTFGMILPLDLEISIDAEHSRYKGQLKEASIKWWGNVQKAIDLQPSQRYPGYGNFLIFPNIVVAYSYGAFLTFQTFDPLSTHSLRINSTAWLAKNNGRAARNMVLESLKAFSESVRNEDRDICAQVQTGIRDQPSNRPLMLGELEGRIAHFQRSYMARMGSASI